MWTKGQSLTLADISSYDIADMALEWMWRAGEEVIYMGPCEDSYNRPSRPSRSYVKTTHITGSNGGRTVWIFDEYLLSEDSCIWE